MRRPPRRRRRLRGPDSCAPPSAPTRSRCCSGGSDWISVHQRAIAGSSAPASARSTQEIVGGAKARVREETERAPALPPMEARLQREQFPHRDGESLRDADAPVLLADDLVHGIRDRGRRRHAGIEALLRGRRHRAEQQDREQEHRRDALAFAHPAIGVGEARTYQRKCDAVLPVRKVRGGRREQVVEQAVLAQQVERALAETRKEELLEFVEQPRWRNVLEQPGERRERRARRLVDGEAELRLETHRAQHPHRVLAVARLRVADQAQGACAHVLDAADVVPDREVLDVVVEGVAGEVAPPHVLVNRPVDVVAQEPTALVVRTVDVAVRLFVLLLFGLGVLVGHAVEVRIRRHRRAGGAEGRNLDDLVAEANVRETKSPADQAAIAEQPPALPRATHRSRRRNPSARCRSGGRARSRRRGTPGSRRPSAGTAP